MLKRLKLFFLGIFVSLGIINLWWGHVLASPQVIPIEFFFKADPQYNYLSSGLAFLLENRLSFPGHWVAKVSTPKEGESFFQVKVIISQGMASYEISSLRKGIRSFSLAEKVSAEEFLAKFSLALEKAREAFKEGLGQEKSLLVSTLQPSTKEGKKEEKKEEKPKEKKEEKRSKPSFSFLGKLNPFSYIAEILGKDKDRLVVKITVPPPPPPLGMENPNMILDQGKTKGGQTKEAQIKARSLRETSPFPQGGSSPWQWY